MLNLEFKNHSSFYYVLEKHFELTKNHTPIVKYIDNSNRQISN